MQALYKRLAEGRMRTQVAERVDEQLPCNGIKGHPAVAGSTVLADHALKGRHKRGMNLHEDVCHCQRLQPAS